MDVFISEHITLAGIMLSIIGGATFGFLLTVHRPIGSRVHETMGNYLSRVVTLMIMFYFTFPFLQGFFGLYEHHQPELLTEVTIAYIIFTMAMFTTALVVYRIKELIWKR